MKKHIKDFFHRGLVSCGFGPMVLAVIYLTLQGKGLVQDISVNKVCLGIFSTAALAFFAGGMNAIYQIERLPLMAAIAIHGVVLYVSYLVTYLLNDWLVISMIPILVFSIIFVVGYLVIWAIIYSSIKKKTERINEMLNMKRKSQA
jgi:CHASE2 domain-containing sensor protein